MRRSSSITLSRDTVILSSLTCNHSLTHSNVLYPEQILHDSEQPTAVRIRSWRSTWINVTIQAIVSTKHISRKRMKFVRGLSLPHKHTHWAMIKLCSHIWKQISWINLPILGTARSRSMTERVCVYVFVSVCLCVCVSEWISEENILSKFRHRRNFVHSVCVCHWMDSNNAVVKQSKYAHLSTHNLLNGMFRLINIQ